MVTCAYVSSVKEKMKEETMKGEKDGKEACFLS